MFLLYECFFHDIVLGIFSTSQELVANIVWYVMYNMYFVCVAATLIQDFFNFRNVLRHVNIVGIKKV
jgi:hypothetical protein